MAGGSGSTDGNGSGNHQDSNPYEKFHQISDMNEVMHIIESLKIANPTEVFAGYMENQPCNCGLSNGQNNPQNMDQNNRETQSVRLSHQMECILPRIAAEQFRDFLISLGISKINCKDSEEPKNDR